MCRKNIFDILSQKESIDVQIEKIEDLLQKRSIDRTNLEHIVNQNCLRYWEDRGICTTCAEIREKLSITDQDLLMKDIDFNTALIYLEYLSNLIWLCKTRFLSKEVRTTQDFQYLQENVAKLIEDLNHEVKCLEDGRVILVEKDAAAIAAAEIAPPETSEKIIEYNHFRLKGNLEGKREILVLLADQFEASRTELKGIDSKLEDNIGFLLNKINIRHNNREGKNASSYVINMTDQELEYWYDETYQMLLLSILELDNIERNKRVVNLKQKMQEYE